jgi:predicted nucleic acid-binding Zn ribbon protein|tara:strand:- start:82 stop:402 length:321 start_codon:yes stop_codon:yes gene_type:complete
VKEQSRRNRTAVKKLGDMLQDTVATVKRARSRNKSLREKWKKAAGEDISNHTEVRMVKSGVLYVEVDSATWLHHVSTFKKEELLASVQSEFKRGHISEIRFRVGVV